MPSTAHRESSPTRFKSFGDRTAFFLILGIALVGTACDRGSQSVAPAPPLLPKPAPVRPQPELALAFAASPQTIFEARTGEDLSKLVVQQQATLSVVPEGLKITATGIDPILLLPSFIERRQAILQVVIKSPVETPIQLFYALRERPEMNEEHSQKLYLKPGTNVVYFQLDHPNLIDPVRLDPVAAPGDFIIESVVARALLTSKAP